MRLRLEALAAATSLIVLLLASSADAQQRRPLVTVLQPRVVVPVIETKKVDVMVPLRLRRGVRSRTVFVELRDVVPEPGRPEVGPGGVSVVVPESRKPPRRLARNARLRVRFKTDLVRPGSYVLRFEAWREGRRSRSMPFSVTVSVPAPVLRPTQPLHVERVLGPGGDKVQPLTVREMSSRAQVTVTEVTQATEESEAGVVAGELTFDKKTVADGIVPGGVLRVAPTATSGFPVGMSNGTVELSVAELDAPLAVPFVVETRFSRAWLALALFLGIVSGWLARYYLRRRIEQGEAQLALESFRARVVSEQSRHLDTEFQNAVAGILREIDDRLDDESSTADRIQKVLAEQQQVFATALAALEQSRAKVKPEVEGRAAALATTRSIPGVVRRELAAVSQLVTLAGQSLTVDALDEARRRVEEADAQFRSQVLGVTGRWRDEVKALTTAVQDAKELMSDAREAAREAAERADSAANASAEEWNKALDAIATAHAAANALRDRVGKVAQAQLARTDDAPAGRMTKLEHALSRLIAALEEANGSALGGYSHAADALRNVLDTPGGDLSAPPPAPFVTGIGSAAYDTAASSWTVPLMFPPDGGRGVERRAWRRAVSRNVRRARLVQGLIIAFVVFVVGYELFQADFIGSVEQLVLAFLWGFSADLSLNAVLALAQQGGAPAQPPAPAQ
jgi:hypothetical protein